MPNMPVPVNAADVVRRAKSAVGTGVYGLGKGGRHPLDKTPLDEKGACDCSGAQSWFLGIDRYQPGKIDGKWVETSAIVRDATGPMRMFSLVAVNGARVGDLMVYGDRGGHQGHVGTISEMSAVGGCVCRVIHCSASNDRNGAAIAETSPKIFYDAGAIIVRFRFLLETRIEKVQPITEGGTP